MNELVSEFFIDIITRIIPGFVILGLYPDKLFHTVFLKFQNLPFLLIPCLIGAAWVVGFTVERITYVPFAIICFFRRKNKRSDHLIADRPYADFFKTKHKKVEESFDYFKFNRRHQLKLDGEKIFCRVMCAISLASCIWPPTSTLLKCGQWPLFRVLCHAIPVYSFFATLVFGAAWLWADRNYIRRIIIRRIIICFRRKRRHPHHPKPAQ